ncbi:glycosyltransferase family 4 protein [Pseudomonas sp. G5(2012)]|uniref:glycosyltransferase family 4 protein n=1 Tax=Pseudomonas sp. G5(2012) TaxID=1268068 RepID=UPI00034312A4|nr:glycosyltransferase family 4 protein [Pseudomonas sp. G5(2012)]EPA93497.1 Glycosyl transferases group 1-like protein [Pseudomonas sp. G5(2012)]
MVDRKLKIVRVSTVPFFIVTQLSATIKALKDSGAGVTVISSDDDLGGELRELVGSDFIPVKMVREINPVQDLFSLILLVKIFRQGEFDIVHSTTPKAGLLCAIAGKIAGVKIRLHTYTGQPWVTMQGVKRHLLKFCDRVIGSLNTRCYTDSFSQQKFLVEQSVIKREKISVLGNGSFAGVDLRRFDATRFSESERSALKSELKINAESKVVIFVGRITKEKGVSELIEAFERLVIQGIDLHLLLVGPYEPDGAAIIDNISNGSVKNRIKNVGFSNIPEKYMAVSDVLCLPSYREGFGTVVIEAAAMGLPTVGTSIYGLSDAVVDGETGLLVPVGDSDSLAASIRSLVTDEVLLKNMSNSARERAQTKFDSKLYSSLLIAEYTGLVKKS